MTLEPALRCRRSSTIDSSSSRILIRFRKTALLLPLTIPSSARAGGKKKKRLQTPGKEETPKKIAKEDPAKKVKRDDRIPEKEWKLIADAAKKVQGARRCHYFNSSLGCISGDSCRFKHLCMVCGEPHAMIGNH